MFVFGLEQVAPDVPFLPFDTAGRFPSRHASRDHGGKVPCTIRIGSGGSRLIENTALPPTEPDWTVSRHPLPQSNRSSRYRQLTLSTGAFGYELIPIPAASDPKVGNLPETIGCERCWLRPNFVAVCLDETEDRAQQPSWAPGVTTGCRRDEAKR